MSHFTVLVVGDNIEEQLKPYQENNMGDCPEEYMEFNDVEDEYRKEYEEGTRSEFYCSSSSSWGQQINKNNFDILKEASIGDTLELDIVKEGGGLGSYFKKDGYYHCYCLKDGKHECPKEHIWIQVTNILQSTHPDPDVCFDGKIEVKLVNDPKEIPLKEFYTEGFDAFIRDWAGYKDKDPNTGRYGYWENPNAKWDWYQVGGRWAGYFIMKHGKKGELGEKSWANEGVEMDKNQASQARKGDIDFKTMKNKNLAESEKTYDAFDELYKSNPDEAKKKAYWDYGIHNVSGKSPDEEFIPESREEYIKRLSSISTFALVKDGKWYEKGKMGWWAMTADEKEQDLWDDQFDSLLEELPDDTTLTVCDCHI